MAGTRTKRRQMSDQMPFGSIWPPKRSPMVRAVIRGLMRR